MLIAKEHVGRTALLRNGDTVMITNVYLDNSSLYQVSTTKTSTSIKGEYFSSYKYPEDIIAIKLDGDWELVGEFSKEELHEALCTKAIKNVAPEYVKAFISTDKTMVNHPGLLDYLESELPDEDMVNHPDHYGGEDNPLEVIKIIDHYKLGFNLGNSIKYILRAENKEDHLGDLKKAQFYLNREIAKMEK